MGAFSSCGGDASQQKAWRCLAEYTTGVLVESGFTGLGKRKLIPSYRIERGVVAVVGVCSRGLRSAG